MAHLFNLIGRVAFAALFLMSSYQAYQNFDGIVQYAASGNWHGIEIPSEHLPYLVGFGEALKVAGALAILGGGHWCGGMMIAMFLIGVTPVMHWPFGEDGSIDQHQMIHALKNLSMLGAALMIAYPPKTQVVKTKKE